MGELSVLIINYKQFELCVRCISSIVVLGIVEESNIVIVDNCSSDLSAEKLALAFPQAKVVISDVNDGYGAGVNLGMAAIATDFVILLNPDTYFVDDSVARVSEVFRENPELGLLGLNLLNSDFSPQHSARRFYSMLDIFVLRTPLKRLAFFQPRLRRHYLLDADRPNETFEADWVMGIGIVVRKASFVDLNGMDERYFLYFEDVDFCARLWIRGWNVACAKNMSLVHDHQRASAKRIFSRAGMIHLKSLIVFARKFGLPIFRAPSTKLLSVRREE